MVNEWQALSDSISCSSRTTKQTRGENQNGVFFNSGHA
jgi:hypothetical protein